MYANLHASRLPTTPYPAHLLIFSHSTPPHPPLSINVQPWICSNLSLHPHCLFGQFYSLVTSFRRPELLQPDCLANEKCRALVYSLVQPWPLALATSVMDPAYALPRRRPDAEIYIHSVRSPQHLDVNGADPIPRRFPSMTRTVVSPARTANNRRAIRPKKGMLFQPF